MYYGYRYRKEGFCHEPDFTIGSQKSLQTQTAAAAAAVGRWNEEDSAADHILWWRHAQLATVETLRLILDTIRR
jgi:hypothetical protein